MGKRNALGRGLEALLPGSVAEVLSGDEILSLPVGDIFPNPEQPRKNFDSESLASLAESIKAQGVLQPILVVRAENGYELVAGERRLRASKMAGLKRIPALVLKEKNPTALFFFSLVENLQREDLNVIEEAFAYKHLTDDFDMTQEQIAEQVGKSRPTVANTLRLLTLPEEIQELVKNGRLSAGHARALLAAGNEDRMIRLARLVIRRGMSVERLDIIAREEKPSPRHKKGRRSRAKKLSPELAALKDSLTRHLGTRVDIDLSGDGGSIRIEFYSDDDLMRIVEILAGD